MGCERITLPGGIHAIVCGRPRFREARCKCGAIATRQCDWKMPKKKSGTCDAHICDRCTYQPEPEIDYCPKHKQQLEETSKQGELLT